MIEELRGKMQFMWPNAEAFTTEKEQRAESKRALRPKANLKLENSKVVI